MKYFTTADADADAIVALSAGLRCVSTAGETASAAAPCTAPGRMGHLQKRSVEKASQGVDSCATSSTSRAPSMPST